MGRWMRIVGIIALGLAIGGCQTFNIRADWDPGIAFDGMQRFHWVEPPKREGADPFADNSLLRKRVRFSIESALAERGYRAVESAAEADFLVTYGVQLDERLKVDGVTSTTGGFGRRRGYGFGTAYSTTNVRAYQESTLIIDFLDPASEALIWRGWGDGIVQTRDRDRGRERLDNGVRQILERFPPETGSD